MRSSRLGRRAAGAIALTVALGSARLCAAASDGFYCTGSDYLAYELNGDGFNAGRHQLWIVKLSGADPMPAPVSVELFPAQTRGIRCLDNAVEVLAPAAVYTVTLGPSTDPQPPISRSIVQGERPVGFPAPESLAGSAVAFSINDLPARQPLDIPAARGRFAIDMSGTPHRLSTGSHDIVPCAIDAETRLIQLDRDKVVRSRTLFKGVVVNSCGPTEFDGETADGHGATLPAPACVAGPGRQVQQLAGEVKEGEDFTGDVGPFQLRLRSEGETGWDLAILEPGRLDDLAQLTSPSHGPSPTDIFAWHFRNAYNTGPPAQGAAAGLGRHREIVFSPEVGRTIRFNLDTLADNRERVSAYGRGSFDVIGYTMTPAPLGEEPRLLWLKFAACLTWPK